jgi:hypothetical protein
MTSTRTIHVKSNVTDSGKWIKLPLTELCDISNVIIEINKIYVDCNLNEVICPWILMYDMLPIIKRKTILSNPLQIKDESPLSGKTIWKVHGLTGNCNVHIDSSTLFTEATKSNIYQYFLSDIHMKYSAVKEAISKKGSWGLRNILEENGDMTTLYSDQKIQCIIVDDQSSRQPIKEFINLLLCNESMSSLLQVFSHNAAQQLSASKDVDTSTFPFTSKLKSRQHLIPFEAIEKSIEFLNELEVNCNLFFIGKNAVDNKNKTCPFVLYIYVPVRSSGEPLTFTCKADVTYRSLQDDVLTGPPRIDALLTPYFDDPVLMSMCEAIHTQKTLETIEKNLHLFCDMYDKQYKK